MKLSIAFAVLPMFAFANVGVSLQRVTLGTLMQPVPLGIMADLLVGKAVGGFSFSWLLVKLAGPRLPAGASSGQLFGVCVLCGVGFTMSFFIGGLAFQGQGADFETQLKIGVLGGSLPAGILGSLILLILLILPSRGNRAVA